MASTPQEWLRQADYDMETAEYMLAGDRNFYAVFMAHLAVEKAVKGLYQLKLGQTPPKTHNVVFLLQQVHLRPGDDKDAVLVRLNEAQILARYQENLEQTQKAYTKQGVRELLDGVKELLTWLRNQF